MAANEIQGADYQADAEAAFYTEDNEEFWKRSAIIKYKSIEILNIIIKLI